MLYGHDKTIHKTNHLDVEVCDGKVVAVWFRCMVLPFKQTNVSAERANDLSDANPPSLVAVEVETK